MTRPGRRLLVLGAALGAALVALAPVARTAPPGGKRAAATENELATREALQVMVRGGNAADAAITAALVGGVASPSSSGLGGGGFVLVWDAARGAAWSLDFRETAPAETAPAAFDARPFAPEHRGRQVGTPGEVAGLFELHRRHGSRPWAELVAPAVRVAREGFPVHAHLGRALREQRAALARDPALARVFLPGGVLAAVGGLLRRPGLAATLERIAAQGPAGFYQGPVAAELVRVTRETGGWLSQADLEGYRPRERAPLEARWAGHRVLTMGPPSAGGLMLAQVLALTTPEELRTLGRDSGATLHLLAECMRGAVADRMRHLGDPEHHAVPLEQLLDPARLAQRRRRIALHRTHAWPRFALEEHGTHHLVTADAAGNFVSLTTTVNRAFGARLGAGDHDVLLNDELDDFTAAADVAHLGLTESPNRARPGARPVSSMTPTLVLRDGRVVLALGGSGGTAIASNVTQLLVSHLAFGTPPAELVRQRRFAVPTTEVSLSVEPGLPAAVLADLAERGEVVRQATSTSAVQVLAVQGGRLIAASDARKFGAAATR